MKNIHSEAQKNFEFLNGFQVEANFTFKNCKRKTKVKIKMEEFERIKEDISNYFWA